ncbi:hypothetical protein BGZ63DRAFT_365176 [Mariannaea sp. PMI_226]|nr:hypothetical protein BGZ63DRAFT_365176 [Mariannaea sp. PMI_226]
MASPQSVEANIAYMKPDDDLFRREKPYVSLVPFLSSNAQFTNTCIEEHLMKIENVRGRESEFNLDKNGFAYVSYTSKERPTHDIKSPDHPYMHEMAKFLKGYLGAKEVTVYDGSTRRIGDPNFLQASLYAHVDHTIVNCRWRVEQLMAEKKREMPRRWQLVNIWAPIKGPIQGSPLAVCDYQSVDREDLVAVDSVFPHHVMEVYHVKHNPSHRWYYMEEQDVDDILIFKTWDSEEEKESCCVHTAIMPNPDDKVMRESIEIRLIVEY